MTKLNDSQKICVVMLMGANRLLKTGLVINDVEDIALATEQINMCKWILGEEIFNSLVDRISGKDNELASDAVQQTRELVLLYKDEEESHDEI